MKKTISFYAIIIFFCVNIQAQYHEISLENKIDNSQIVIEGEVMESESYRTADNNIYTAHKVKIFKSFNENPVSDHLSIITRGGSFDGAKQTWTHMLTLSQGQTGVFFLNDAVNPPSNLRTVTDKYYQVYSGEQGYIRYSEKATGLVASELFHSYEDISKDLFSPMHKAYGKTFLKYADTQLDYEKKNEVIESYTSSIVQDGRCLDFLFEVLSPNPNDPFLISTVVSIKASENTRITKPVIVAKYNTLNLGSNIASGGLVTLEDIGVSANINYETVLEDAARG
ncbi:MAG: hypothetical protein ACI9J3_000228 [Parvicellaceae bacterium]|jgi:hypothetical protein